jgi:hypothetical protein
LNAQGRFKKSSPGIRLLRADAVLPTFSTASVKMRKSRNKHMSVGLAPVADMKEPFRHFAFVPDSDMAQPMKNGRYKIAPQSGSA